MVVKDVQVANGDVVKHLIGQERSWCVSHTRNHFLPSYHSLSNETVSYPLSLPLLLLLSLLSLLLSNVQGLVVLSENKQTTNK